MKCQEKLLPSAEERSGGREAEDREQLAQGHGAGKEEPVVVEEESLLEEKKEPVVEGEKEPLLEEKEEPA